MPGFTLPEENRAELTSALRVLGVSQRDVAERAKNAFSSAWTSNLLSGNRAVRDLALIEAFAGTLEAILAEKQASQAVDADKANQVVLTLDRLRAASGLERRRMVAAPGGVIPRTAANYIRRGVDDQLDDCVRNTPFAVFVSGPPQSGKSTLLWALASEARARRFNVVTYDFAVAPHSKDENGQPIAPILRLALGQIADALLEFRDGSAAAYHPDEDISRFASWLRRAFSGSAREAETLLVLNGTTRLSLGDLLDFVHLLRAIDSDASLYRTGMNLAVEIAFDSLQGFASTTRSISFAEHLVAGWFSDQETKRLLESLGVARTADFYEQVHADYGGQPFLSHVVATWLAHGPTKDDPDAAFQNVLAAQGTVQQHLPAVKKLLSRPGVIEAYERFSGKLATAANLTEPDLQFLLQMKLSTFKQIDGPLSPASTLYSRLLPAVIDQLKSAREADNSSAVSRADGS